MEVEAHHRLSARHLYEHGPQGNAYMPCLAGNGLIQGRLGRDSLALNSIDLESTLFGVGSTNLARPQDNLRATAERVVLPSMDLFRKQPTYVPRPVVFDASARPRYI